MCTSNENFLNNIEVDANELSLTAKLTSVVALSIKGTHHVLTPFYNLLVTEGKRGHPYMSDLLVHNIAISVSRSKQLVIVLEVKKVVSPDFSVIDHSHLIEMLLYTRYLVTLNQLETLIGGITDGVNTSSNLITTS